MGATSLEGKQAGFEKVAGEKEFLAEIFLEGSRETKRLSKHQPLHKKGREHVLVEAKREKRGCNM